MAGSAKSHTPSTVSNSLLANVTKNSMLPLWLLVSFNFITIQPLYFSVKDSKLVGVVTFHVDDLSVIGPSEFVATFKANLASHLVISSNEEVHHFFSLKIRCDVPRKLVFVNQSHCIKEVGATFLSSSHVATHTPTDESYKNLGPRSDTKADSPGHYCKKTRRPL